MKLYKSKKLQLVLLLLTIVIIISGVSYAFFRVNVTNNSSTNAVSTGNMAISYTDGSEVSLENIIPGDSITKTFSVKNIGNVTASYNIYFLDVLNTFINQSDLVYTLTSNSGFNSSSNTQVPDDDNMIVNKQIIAPNETQSYTLKIIFLNKDEPQDVNQGKKLNLKINISDSDINLADNDYTIAAYIDNAKVSNMPQKGTGYKVSNITCTNGSSGTWNTPNWSLIVANTTTTGTKCNVYFVSDPNNGFSDVEAVSSTTVSSTYGASGKGTDLSLQGTTNASINFTGITKVKITYSYGWNNFGAKLISSNYTLSNGQSGNITNGAIIDVTNCTSMTASITSSSGTTDQVNYFWSGSIVLQLLS